MAKDEIRVVYRDYEGNRWKVDLKPVCVNRNDRCEYYVVADRQRLPPEPPPMTTRTSGAVVSIGRLAVFAYCVVSVFAWVFLFMAVGGAP